jgi:thiamine-monophosphate kinase
LVVTVDALVAGVHFLADDPADLVARKALRVNLSDLAAKGARPLGYFLATAFGDQDEDWVEGFTAGLAADQQTFAVSLLGGDTVATPGPLTIAVTAIGEVAAGRALRRSRACPGDRLFVTGTLGDGALGLKALRGELSDLPAAQRTALAQRYRLPEPRLAFGQALAERGLAACGMDISDGLAADLGHICKASAVGATVEFARLPLSAAATAALRLNPAWRDLVFAGGDDYELLIAAPAAHGPDLLALGAECGLRVSEIGRVAAGDAVEILDEGGAPIELTRPGYRHF